MEPQVGRIRPDGPLVFDDTGVTAHPDHQAATRAAVAAHCDLPILTWSLLAAIADQLRRESGQPFVGRPPDELDLCIRVARAAQRRTAFAHRSVLAPRPTAGRMRAFALATPLTARTAKLDTVCTSAPRSLHGGEV